MTVAIAGKVVLRYGWAMPRYALGCLGRCSPGESKGYG